MKNILAITLLLLTNSAFCTPKIVSTDKPMINLFELKIKEDHRALYDSVAKNNITASIKNERDTLAMYSIKHKDNLYQAYMIEIYSNSDAYAEHLNSIPYQYFIKRAPEFIEQKHEIKVVPQFLSDKKVLQNRHTINNFVIVDVKPEYQQAFKKTVLPEMAQSLKIENGVLAMYAAIDANNENRWYFYEIYASEADYQKHRTTTHFQEYIKKTADMTTSKESIPVTPDFLENKGGMTTTFTPQ